MSRMGLMSKEYILLKLVSNGVVAFKSNVLVFPYEAKLYSHSGTVDVVLVSHDLFNNINEVAELQVNTLPSRLSHTSLVSRDKDHSLGDKLLCFHTRLDLQLDSFLEDVAFTNNKSTVDVDILFPCSTYIGEDVYLNLMEVNALIHQKFDNQLVCTHYIYCLNYFGYNLNIVFNIVDKKDKNLDIQNPENKKLYKSKKKESFVFSKNIGLNIKKSTSVQRKIYTEEWCPEDPLFKLMLSEFMQLAHRRVLVEFAHVNEHRMRYLLDVLNVRAHSFTVCNLYLGITHYLKHIQRYDHEYVVFTHFDVILKDIQNQVSEDAKKLKKDNLINFFKKVEAKHVLLVLDSACSVEFIKDVSKELADYFDSWALWQVQDKAKVDLTLDHLYSTWNSVLGLIRQNNINNRPHATTKTKTSVSFELNHIKMEKNKIKILEMANKIGMADVRAMFKQFYFDRNFNFYENKFELTHYPEDGTASDGLGTNNKDLLEKEKIMEKTKDLYDVEELMRYLQNNLDLQTKINKNSSLNIPNINWEDVGCMSREKDLLTYTFGLNQSSAFSSKSKRKGVLLSGPPGTGKTFIAKAVASECKYHFISCKGPELLSAFVGETEKNVRDLFARALKSLPCILFFDEIDSIASRKQSSNSDLSSRIISQLCAELDNVAAEPIYIIGASNRPDLIDSSLKRPGRFDNLVQTKVYTDYDSRYMLLKSVLHKYSHSLGALGDVQTQNESLRQVVNLCVERKRSYTGADYQNLCTYARDLAINRRIVDINMQVIGVEVCERKADISKVKQFLNEHLHEFNNASDQGYLICLNDLIQAVENCPQSVTDQELARYTKYE